MPGEFAGNEDASGGVDGKPEGASRSGQPRVERRQRCRPGRHRESQVERVGGAERCLLPRQEEVLRSTMYLASQLDAVVHAPVEAPENRMPESPGGLPRERPLLKATSNGRDDLGDGKIRYEDIIPALYDFVELVAAGFGKI